METVWSSWRSATLRLEIKLDDPRVQFVAHAEPFALGAPVRDQIRAQTVLQRHDGVQLHSGRRLRGAGPSFGPPFDGRRDFMNRGRASVSTSGPSTGAGGSGLAVGARMGRAPRDRRVIGFARPGIEREGAGADVEESQSRENDDFETIHVPIPTPQPANWNCTISDYLDTGATLSCHCVSKVPEQDGNRASTIEARRVCRNWPGSAAPRAAVPAPCAQNWKRSTRSPMAGLLTGT